MKILIGGVNGSKERTILNSFALQNKNYKVVSVSKYFSNWLGFNVDYEKLRALSFEYKDFLLERVMKELGKGRKKILLDSHYLNLVRGVVTKTTKE